MKTVKLFIFSLTLLSFLAHATENTLLFSPAPGIKAEITRKSNILTWEIYYHGGTNKDHIDIYTEKPIHIDVGDYDFSGRRGFAVWHTDDGMGTYSIYRIFTFSPKTNKFVEQNPAPLCGDEFINLKIDKKNKRLLSTSWNQNVPKPCITRPSTPH